MMFTNQGTIQHHSSILLLWF